MEWGLRGTEAATANVVQQKGPGNEPLTSLPLPLVTFANSGPKEARAQEGKGPVDAAPAGRCRAQSREEGESWSEGTHGEGNTCGP